MTQDVSDHRLSVTTTAAPRAALLRNHVMPYAWGSPTSLAELQGRVPTGAPEAELWMGAHPLGPSRLVADDGGETDLAQAVATQARGLLGASCCDRFGPRLPFMLKVLAIDVPLSIQVHPTEEQANEGFAAEEAAGIPLGDPRRRYVDPHGKPEQFVALSAMDALVGLRPAAEMVRLLDYLPGHVVGTLREVVLAAGTAEAFLALCTMPDESREGFVHGLHAGLPAALDAAVLDGDLPAAAALEWALTITGLHPRDPLAIAPLVMQLHRLAPGDSLYVAPGVPHAYLSGLAVEALCSSDNVARAGLTPKVVDADVFRGWMGDGAPVHPVAPVVDGPVTRWPSPTPEFELTRVDATSSPVPLPGDVPRIGLCTAGRVRLATGREGVDVARGESAFLAASRRPLVVTGAGTVFLCAPQPGLGRPEVTVVR